MGVTERRKREREIRREAAIDAAMAIYDEEGYHAITMEKIAERAELSRAALYLYFKNKEEILISSIVANADYFALLLEQVYRSRESVKERLLEKLWESFEKFYENDPVAFTAWQYFHQSEMIANLTPELRDLLHEVGSKVVALQHKIVGYAVEEKVFIDCDPRALAQVIWSSFLGIAYLEKSKTVIGSKSHLEGTRKLALEILTRGVTAGC